MKEIPLTQNKVTIVDDSNFDFLNKWKWYFQGRYAAREARTSDGGVKKIYLHRLVLNTPDGVATDHINGNTLDNRRENLRTCSKKENLRNRGKQKNNVSGYKGVYRHRDGAWVAKIQVDGKHRALGSFKTKEEAAFVYNNAAKKYFGEFAYLNELKEEE